MRPVERERKAGRDRREHGEGKEPRPPPEEKPDGYAGEHGRGDRQPDRRAMGVRRDLRAEERRAGTDEDEPGHAHA